MSCREVEILCAERYVQGESPRWDAHAGELIWVDMATGRLHRGELGRAGLVPGPSVVVGSRIGCAAPVAPARSEAPPGKTQGPSSGWVVAADQGFWRVARDGTVTAVDATAAPGWAFMNDGGCDPGGRFWAGTQSLSRTPRCGLYSLEADGRVVERLAGVTVSNGLAFSADGRTLYYIDTLPNRSVEAFDVAQDGRLGGRRHVVTVPDGNPDGMAIDDEGALWVAVWDGARVDRYSAQGRLIESVPLPARRPTALALAAGMLVVTTASVGLPDPGEVDGAVLGIDVGLDGPAALSWRPDGME
ncbi:SMP-30/gluconolactonase/LRE family protein [Promicromonospora sp. MEB111]|uniref:SMP-30/gluconolactonase/LRE family protein n=1 Tax=Promicromonospora sp. MEB111 TaxID=3040301 RepID=UPI00254CAF90|nr:SMP-30/gluconolactonase/LRE family protein [Promicromonospora sp. MEB111]